MTPADAPAPSIRPDGAGFVLTTSQYVNRPLQDAFAFFADAANLQRITPAFLGFDIRTPLPIAMHDGTLIEYRIRLGGIPMKWLTRIERWRPGVEFVDTQLQGPYAKWVHLHTFRAEGAGTRMEDRVEYRLPLAPLSHLAHALFVRPMLERIFRHRFAVIADKLG
ncbi:MAG: SRPBCC family protein [Candidatus Eisenbacteria bacterium]